jgi:hypothetical protein
LTWGKKKEETPKKKSLKTNQKPLQDFGRKDKKNKKQKGNCLTINVLRKTGIGF